MDTAHRLRVVALTNTNTEHTLTWHLRVECMLPHLRALGIDVDTVHLSRDTQPAEQTLALQRGYDIAWIHRQTFCGADLSRISSMARFMVLDIDDPVHLSSSHFLNFSLGRLLRFRATAKACAAVLAASRGLVADARRYNANVHLAPLCADPDAYAMTVRPRLPNTPLRMLWLGSRSTFKYLEGARVHLEQVGQHCPGVELTIVGHAALQLRHLRVHNIPWSPKADREALDRCHVGLAPMRNDRWTRSKAALKPLQYMASGMPFIGNGVGVLVDLADGGRNGLLAETPEQWVAAVRQLNDDESQRSRMGTNGLEYIRRRHSPEVLARKIAEVFQSVASGTTLAKSAAA